MPTTLSVVANTIPAGFCFSTWQNLLNTFVSNLIVSIPGNIALFNYGASTPNIEDRDKPWIKLNSDGTFAGVFIFVNGGWYTTYPFATGDVMMFSGAESAVADPWFIANGQTVVRAWGSFTTPDLRGRFLLASGQGAGLTNRLVGQSGGEELHTMTEAELFRHQHLTAYGDASLSHVAPIWGVDSSSGSRYFPLLGGPQPDPIPFTSFVGSTTPFNEMPPYYVLACKCFIKPNN